MDISRENLIKSGYKEYQNSYKFSNNSYHSSYQKRINDKNGKKYFISLHCYDYEHHTEKFNNGGAFSFGAEGQFCIEKEDDREEIFNIDYFVYTDPNYRVTQVEDVEKFFEKLWTNMGCRYYELRD